MFRILVILVISVSSLGFVFLKSDPVESASIAKNCSKNLQLSTFAGKGLMHTSKPSLLNKSDNAESC